MLTPISLRPTPTKVCALCGQALPPDAFARRRKSVDGLQRHCRACGRQQLDAASVRRKARRAAARAGIIGDRDSLVAAIRLHAEDLADALHAVALAGAADVVDQIANALCPPPCPAATGAWAGPECLPHDLGAWHANSLAEQVPAIVQAMDPAWQRAFASAAAPPDAGAAE